MKDHVLTDKNWWDQLLEYFKGYPAWVVESGVAAVIAFFAGFFLRNFGRYIFFIVITLLVAGYVLDYFSLATFHIAQVKQTLGISDISSFDVAVKTLSAWVKTHIPATVGAFIGFLFGWKLGK